MSDDKELQVRLQFLEEAQEYLDTMESGLLGLAAGKVNSQTMDGVLRAAHSIKGGAAMMGFQQLSHLAHRLEDFFKILKVGKKEVVDSNLESLLLSTVDFLRQIIAVNRKQQNPEQHWLEQTVNPIFEQLHQRLGDPQPEDAAALLSAEMGEDMSTLIFETEVEELLQKLENSFESPATTNLLEELLLAAQELQGLSEILDLPAFGELCQSVIDQIEANPEQLLEIAQIALQEWRRSQALVLIGQIEVLPNRLELNSLSNFEFSTVDTDSFNLTESEFFGEELPNSTFIHSLLNTNNLEQEALELFSSLDDLTPDEPLESFSPATLQSTTKFVSRPSEESIPVQNNFVSSSSSPEIQPQESVSDQTIRVSVKQLEQLSDLFGEVIIERNGLDLRLKSLRHLILLLTQRIKNLEQSNFKLRIAYDKVATEAVMTQIVKNSAIDLFATNIVNTNLSNSSTITINPLQRQDFDSLEMDSYSDIHLLSQEVMETVVQIQEVTKDLEISLEETQKNARDLNRTTKQMQGAINQVRMRPIADLLGRFPRALRDMEMQYGKKVELKIRGASTLIDRSILEALNDPLLHLFRNAFDHGIEEPAKRRANNKSERGVITISASHRGNQTVISISDDGQGIDLEKIKTKAISIGVSPEDLTRAKPEDLLELIFEPGFSTAEQITDLSGRGVGMDVVRTNLEQVNGKINVNTSFGVGTTFTITVPFTLSVVRVLLVESNGMLLALPTNVVEEMIVLQPEMVLQAAGQEVLNWDGFIVRLIRLHQWLNLSSSGYSANNEVDDLPAIDEPTILMIAQGNDLVGILVDRYWQEQEVTIRQVEGNIPLPRGFTGCTILGNGRVVPLIDAIALIGWIDNDRHVQGKSLLSSHSAGNFPEEIPSTTASRKKTIMVVDDSINVRRFLAMTLEKANYRVEQAKDGQDALEKLKTGAKIDAVISDIEMPRLDGFGFLSRIKSEPNHKHLPIIMLTSRSGDKHRKLAMSLGAKSYFSKPFKEQELLKTLEEITRV
ncbi:CheA signal transduction histidine kinase [Stanieria cyanosphaera PCC 7437]|uniref:histidine kinase n=1 Tax=Stanieria cyanosphaera (strain ATCC 29371 / PCC 7437) TaxID=111780 RepID=K9Y0Q9_STAC7|nr:response regulator [Stanieria cyanosphaera]AFZ37894.1 CheA signal transduction histidine kinase [Stanieria cyanosphaera PCC 7437]